MSRKGYIQEAIKVHIKTIKKYPNKQPLQFPKSQKESFTVSVMTTIKLLLSTFLCDFKTENETANKPMFTCPWSRVLKVKNL